MRKGVLLLTLTAAGALAACKKTGDGQYQVITPGDVSVKMKTDTHTVRTPTIGMGKETTQVVTPRLQVTKDTSLVITPKLRIKKP